jgi:coenzyme Q-binding protein COQ10
MRARRNWRRGHRREPDVPRHAETRQLPYSPTQMFDLVADVARYQEFLPWVVATRVRSNSDTEMLADLIVGFGPLRETFTSRVNKQRATRIVVDYIEGPLKYLHNEWEFRPDDKGGTLVDFSVDFAFRSRTFETLAGRFFGEAVRRMVSAFEARAKLLYGAAPQSVPSGSSSSSAHSAA